MKLKFQKQKRKRIKCLFRGFYIDQEVDLWFNHNNNKWEAFYPGMAGEKGFSNCQPCKSVRAFRRKLKSAPKGVKFKLSNRFVGYDVIGYGNSPV